MEFRPRPDRPSLSDTTASLLDLIRAGDAGARDRLIQRYLPALQRWARGRLPRYCRDLNDTDDLVQVSLLRALDHLEDFEQRREGGFLAYLRRILLNQIRDLIRRSVRRPAPGALPDTVADTAPSPLEAALGREALDAYEKALATLPGQQQEAVVLRMEMGFTHGQVAEALGFPSANAARMAVARALLRVAEAMDD